MIRLWSLAQPLSKKFSIDFHIRFWNNWDTVDLTEKTDNKIISNITNARRTAEKWEAARKNLGSRKPILEVRKKTKKKTRFDYEKRFDKPKNFKNWF
jgi:hypothetical protein